MAIQVSYRDGVDIYEESTVWRVDHRNLRGTLYILEKGVVIAQYPPNIWSSVKNSSKVQANSRSSY